MCKNCSDIRWHRLNSNQSKTNCPKNLNSDGLIVREMGPWPECIFRSLLQFLVILTSVPCLFFYYHACYRGFFCVFFLVFCGHVLCVVIRSCSVGSDVFRLLHLVSLIVVSEEIKILYSSSSNRTVRASNRIGCHQQKKEVSESTNQNVAYNVARCDSLTKWQRRRKLC